MLKIISNKNFFIEIFILINILKEHFLQLIDNKEELSFLVNSGKKYGYDLTNPNDIFFLDICESFSYNQKDVTLEYKRKYFFFSEKKSTLYNFTYPKNNNTNSCFFHFLDINHFFKNIAFLFLFPLFLLQISLIIISLLFSSDNSFYNTPSKKIELQKQHQYFCFQKNKKKKKKDIEDSFSEFVPEVNNGENKDNNNTKESLADLNVENNNKNNSNENVSAPNKKIEKEKSENSDKIKIILSHNIDSMNQGNFVSKNTAEFGDHRNDEGIKGKNIDDLIAKEKNKNEELNDDIEKSLDNYSFGNNKINFVQKNSSDNQNQMPDDNIKRREYIYKSFNMPKNEDKKKDKYNKKSNSQIQNNHLKNSYIEEIQYTREEYFYFGYLLTRIEDKRTMLKIYYDLLEQCQIIFKFFFIPFNIYEDKRIQILYYIFKLQSYFLYNCLLTKSYVINNIYDNKNLFLNDLYRSIKASIYTYIIGLFVYKLTNIKKTLIKRRYRLANIRISEQRINLELFKTTYFLCKDHLSNKIFIFNVVIIINYLYTFYACYSFCAVYIYTQLYVLKCVLLSIIISQISPFIFCWIPSYIRKKSIDIKNEKLFKFIKIIEFFFIA